MANRMERLEGVMTFPNDRLHHLAGALTHMASRLSDHIERVDQGNVAAIDDLAVTLRSLVGSGKGNAVLLTACRVFRIDQPALQASRSPASSSAYLSIGSLPVEEPGAKVHGARELRLSKWIQEPVLRCVTKSGSVSYSWDKFIREYANKWGGAHLDSQVPEELYTIDRHAAAGLVMSAYLLRAAGVAVWGMTQSVLGKALRPNVETGDLGTFAAPGSDSPKPEYRKQCGQLQWLTLSSDSMDFGWYVDHFSQTNTLRLSFGAVPYDIHYQPEGADPGAVFEDLEPLGPRRESHGSPIVVDPSRTGAVTGVMVPIQTLMADSMSGHPTDGSTAAECSNHRN
ncbi:hypothetical protein AB0C97_13980 [Streptomyces goshikiensis]|uniref:hypothetical protein n=1 Tax=Streptomyces goshikiensis TaxID=1942 RepID=UPI0033EA966E